MEDALGNAVEVVSVGDAAMTESHETLVQASREAMINASRHGGGTVSVYLEVSNGRTEIFVKDPGPGFDCRMSAAITSTPDGTEVRLGMPALQTENGEGKS